MKLLGQLVQDAPRLASLAALDRRVSAEAFADGAFERFRAFDAAGRATADCEVPSPAAGRSIAAAGPRGRMCGDRGFRRDVSSWPRHDLELDRKRLGDFNRSWYIRCCDISCEVTMPWTEITQLIFGQALRTAIDPWIFWYAAQASAPALGRYQFARGRGSNPRRKRSVMPQA